jgi:hypothetical protein
MFAALLGYNPIKMLLGPTLAHLPASSQAYLTGHSFFPSLISAPFEQGLQIAFDFSIACCLIAAVASLLRGKRYVHGLDAVEADADVEAGSDVEAVGAVPAAARAAANGTTVTGRAAVNGTAAGLRPPAHQAPARNTAGRP